MIDFPDKYRGVKAVLYARVSSQEQAKGFSTIAQQNLLQEYAQHPARNIDVVGDHFVDEETAKVVGRTRFNQMLQYLKAHPEVKHVLVEKTD